jgi:predicted nucleotidyltransferase
VAIETVEQAFEEFEKEVARVPDDENAAAKELHPQIRKEVEDNLAVDRHFLAGSYGRKTQAEKLNDVDIVVVLKDPDGVYAASASDTLEAVRKIVAASPLVRHTRVKVRAVKALLHDHEFSVDIVPALAPAWGDGLLLPRNLPDEGYDDWTTENPGGQITAARDKNKVTGGIYVPATRVIKTWNQRYPTAKPLRSYHAEALLYHALTSTSTLPEAVLAFFDHAYNALAPYTYTQCPGNPGRFVDDRLSEEDRAAAREKIDTARAKANAAAELDDPGKAMDAWVKVFGSGFPAPSTQPDAIAKELREGATFAIGSGLSTSREPDSRPIIAGRSWKR